MKGANAVYFGDYLELIFEVIPQVVLMMCLFGLMDLMIIVKWLTDWDRHHHDEPTEVAPGVISTMIVMFIKGGVKPEAPEGEVVEADIFENQTTIMRVALLCAVITVPLMLCVKPIVLSMGSKGEGKVDDGIQ